MYLANHSTAIGLLCSATIHAYLLCISPHFPHSFTTKNLHPASGFFHLHSFSVLRHSSHIVSMCHLTLVLLLQILQGCLYRHLIPAPSTHEPSCSKSYIKQKEVYLCGVGGRGREIVETGEGKMGRAQSRAKGYPEHPTPILPSDGVVAPLQPKALFSIHLWNQWDYLGPLIVWCKTLRWPSMFLFFFFKFQYLILGKHCFMHVMVTLVALELENGSPKLSD